MSRTPSVEACNCAALRRASRHVSRFYDQYLAPHGLTVGQYALLARLARVGPRAIHELADELAMDRTTLARNLKPLERDGLVTQAVDPRDRRSRTVTATEQGQELIRRARPAWEAAQRRFDEVFGSTRAVSLREQLQAVVEAQLTEPDPE